MSVFQGEGIVFLDEGINGSVTFKDFRAPERRYSWKRSWFIGSIVVTQKTFAVFSLIRLVFLLPLGDGRLSHLHCKLHDRNHIRVSFDASFFNEASNGEVECSLRTHNAAELLELLGEMPTRPT